MSRNFTERVKRLPWVAHSAAADGTNILAVNNHLLVDANYASDVETKLADDLNVEARLLTTLFTDLKPLLGNAQVDDVNIYELIPAEGSKFDPESRRHGIFWLMGQLRETLAGIPESAVSPNHILIPAPNLDECPFGAPSPVEGNWAIRPPQAGPQQHITVIDSGWQWNDDWGPNPLQGRVKVVKAERLPTLAEAGVATTWQAGFDEEPGASVPGTHRLVALAGHANFIAGVIARRCTEASITVINHNGSFIEMSERRAMIAERSDDPNCHDVPTEAAVARSLCWAMSHNATVAGVRPPAVINLGFAFLPWRPANALLVEGVVSCIWDRAFMFIGPHPMVVSPVGNQESSLRRYPAALWKNDPVLFKNMIGVGSVDDPQPRDEPQATYELRSSADFTNYAATGDDWVVCSAPGANVISNFLSVDMALEDSDDNDTHDFKGNSWAIWNGTSFATPKVVAAIANKLVAGAADPWTAWQTLAQAGVPPLPQPPGDPSLGIILHLS